MDRVRILVVDDDPEVSTLVRMRLAAQFPFAQIKEYNPMVLGRPEADFAWSDYDLMLLDYKLGGGDNGIEWLKLYRNVEGFPPTIMLTAEGGVYIAVQAMRLGAVDYLVKQDASAERLSAVVAGIVDRDARDTSNFDTITSNPLRASAHRKPRLPPKFHHYTINSLLGRGSTSNVYAATNTLTGQQVALKAIDTDNMDRVQGLDRFLLEAEFLSRADSSHVVKILEQGIGDDFVFIAMERLPGGQLRERIQRGIDHTQALDYLWQIALGLASIHSAGIVHRDLKPVNIMFRQRGDLVLADFGISRYLRLDQALTPEDALLGTPVYMSPEQGSRGEIDERSDLYSAGIIFYEMLTGKPPFNAEKPLQTIYQHVHQTPEPLPFHLTSLQPLMDKLLAKSPDDRFVGASELLQAVGDYLH